MAKPMLPLFNGTSRTAMFCLFLVLWLLFVCYVDGSAVEMTSSSKDGKGQHTAVQAGTMTTAQVSATFTTESSENTTQSDSSSSFMTWDKKLRELYTDGAVARTMCVLIGITTVLLLYFGIQFYRTRRWKNKVKKYRITDSRISAKEAVPLESWKEEEDETTLFTRYENGKT